jgi:hypothetical protein
MVGYRLLWVLGNWLVFRNDLKIYFQPGLSQAFSDVVLMKVKGRDPLRKLEHLAFLKCRFPPV